MLLSNENAIDGGGYNIINSLRFIKGSTQYLSRTPSVTGNRQIWTFSVWVKRGTLSTIQSLAGSQTNALIDDSINFSATDALQITGFSSSTLQTVSTTAVFRDPSAWYHIIVSVNTTQVTAANRIIVYINGIQSTLSGTFIPQNYSFQMFDQATYATGIGCQMRTGVASYPFDGYMTEINLIDGQALTPSSFGYTNADTNQWVAKKYSGTYGTNGCYLNFSNGTSTTTLGTDSSGNNNTYTLTNFTRSAGASDCWMVDVPSGNASGSGTRPSSNYAVLNPLDVRGTSATVSSVTNANLRATTDTSTGSGLSGNIAVNTGTGKYYWEVSLVSGIVVSSAACHIGICEANTPDGIIGTQFGYYSSDTTSYTNGDLIGVAYDASTSIITFYKNNVLAKTITSASGTKPLIPFIRDNIGTGFIVADFNFGQRSFTYTPPSGYNSLCTSNLPIPTITKPNKYMGTTLYTGNGTNINITSALIDGTLPPDFVWLKSRSAATNNGLFDSVRGFSKALYSNTTGAEVATAGVGSTTSTTISIGGDGAFNTNAATYAAWQWAAGTGAVTNTAGSITSQVNAGALQGFSIVTYTGTGVAATIGHGLGVAPKFILVKCRNTVDNWNVYHTSLGNTTGLNLNTVTAATANIGWWNNTSPTNTTISVGTYQTINTQTYVAYCFAEIAGYSKFGSYTGNGNVDGTFTYLGFKPAYILLRNSNAATNWTIYDNKRLGYNVNNNQLYCNSTSVEASGVATTNPIIDITANGFKVRGTDTSINGSTNIIFYAAFAESPFQYSNAV